MLTIAILSVSIEEAENDAEDDMEVDLVKAKIALQCVSILEWAMRAVLFELLHLVDRK
ncbi:hypothetical protein IVA98_13370 [Bradyrhizobium sp. 160]|uniref:hypothetical protein n=1 Tax=Bradyrhizobium sp. 160 TaxID=2782634 RepID=UPI001FF7EF35|nr:hypothetical protein [Bradyrhizobium sp. 160]MCK1624137.1 hypothetical protein [Bradyrhizobium sp. 160]